MIKKIILKIQKKSAEQCKKSNAEKCDLNAGYSRTRVAKIYAEKAKEKFRQSCKTEENDEEAKEYYDKKIKQKEKRENRNREKSLSAAD